MQNTQPSATGFAITPLGGEQMVDVLNLRRSPLQFLLNLSLTTVDRDVYLSTKRLILYETRHFLGIIPRGTSFRAAMVHDVDAVKTDRRRLPLVWLIAGLLAIVSGVFTAVNSGGDRLSDSQQSQIGPTTVIAVLIGLGLIALWLLIQPSVLSFNVDGDEVFHAPVFHLGLGDSTRISAFVHTFFQIKDVAPAPVSGAPPSAQATGAPWQTPTTPAYATHPAGGTSTPTRPAPPFGGNAPDTPTQAAPTAAASAGTASDPLGPTRPMPPGFTWRKLD